MAVLAHKALINLLNDDFVVRTGQRLQQSRGHLMDGEWGSQGISFAGKSFYMDLPPNKQTQLLAKAIGKLGGVIESFLSRDITYVVTGSRKVAGTASGSTARTRRGGSRCQAAERKETVHCSRGKQLLKKALHSQEYSSVLTSARSWGVCILYVDGILYYIMLISLLEREMKTLFQKDDVNLLRIHAVPEPSCLFQSVSLHPSVGKLKSPFLKIEDQSRKYRPLHCSFSSFPEFSFISSDKSPFETVQTPNRSYKEKDPGEHGAEEVERAQVKRRRGYCECCEETYEHLSEHLVGDQHYQFATNPSHYLDIDNLAAQLPCDLMELSQWSPSKSEVIQEDPRSDAEVADAEHARTGEKNLEFMRAGGLARAEGQCPRAEKIRNAHLLCEDTGGVPAQFGVVAGEELYAGFGDEDMWDTVLPEQTVSAAMSHVVGTLGLTPGAIGELPVEDATCKSHSKLLVAASEDLCILPVEEAVGIEMAEGEVPSSAQTELHKESRVHLLVDVSQTGLTLGAMLKCQDPADEQQHVLNPQENVQRESTAVIPLGAATGESHVKRPLADDLLSPMLQRDAPGASYTELPQVCAIEKSIMEQPVVDSTGKFHVDCGDAAGEFHVVLPLVGALGDSHVEAPLVDVSFRPCVELPLGGNPVCQHMELPHENAPAISETEMKTKSAESPVEQLLGNATNKSLAQLSCSNTLSLGQLSLAPLHPVPGAYPNLVPICPSIDTCTQAPCEGCTLPLHSTFHPLSNSSQTLSEKGQTNTNWLRCKRKHSDSSPPPPAKRHVGTDRSTHCQPLTLPLWMLCQIPSYGHQVPTQAEWTDFSIKVADKGATTNSPHSPINELDQDGFSSESDWDAQLPSLPQKNPGQTQQYGDLRTAQVSLNESWYGKQLCSILTHDP
ncbi:protein DBF4 homolog B [Rhinophrynus dorsalis]